ncbi:MAG: PEP-CTERM sorting domain-containing protein [Acidobacteriota bacterium]
MEKKLLLLGVLAISTTSLFGAPCTNGLMSTQPFLSVCEITNGANTWTLNYFHQSQAATGSLAGTMGSDIRVTFALVGNGFSVTYTPAVDGADWRAPGLGSQTGFLETNYRIYGSTGGARLSQYVTSAVLSQGYNEGTGTSFGAGPDVTLKTWVQDFTPIDFLTGSLTGTQTVLTANNTAPPATLTSGAPPQTVVGGLTSAYVVVNRLNLDSFTRPGAVAAVSSFTNIFQPASDIPEPMTFALMGAGLIGIAVLRRRQS